MRPDTKRALLIFAVFACVYLTTMTGYLTQDGETFFLVTQAIVERGSVAIEPEPGGFQTINAVEGAHGKGYAWYNLGISVLLIPHYLSGKTLAAISGQNPALVKRFIASAFNPMVMALVVALVFIAARRIGAGPRHALLVAVIFGLATVAWFYSKRLFREPALAAATLAAYIFIDRFRDNGSLKELIFASACLGLAGFVKITHLIVAPLFALLLVWPKKKEDAPEKINYAAAVKNVSILAVFSVLAVIGFLIYNHVRFGSPFESGARAEYQFDYPFYKGIYGLLLSPGRGFFIFSLPAVLGIAGLVKLWKTRPAETILFAGQLVLLVLMYCSWDAWHGANSWGPRLIMPAVPFMIIPLALLDDWAFGEKAGKKIAFYAVIGVSLVMQFISIAVWSRTTVGESPLYVEGVTLEDEAYNPKYQPHIQHLKAFFGVKFTRVQKSGGSLYSDPAVRQMKNDGLAFWWVFLWRLGFPGAVLLAPVMFLGGAGVAVFFLLHSVQREE
ncbi:MAG: phospholipid carrier-dependent glycosyltransferase [Planctomycetota bacterium]|jgi:hypothetical protein